MSRTRLHILATVLLLAALALLVLGLGDGPDLVWNIGMGLVAAAMLFAFATQWVGDDDPEHDGDDEEESEGKDQPLEARRDHPEERVHPVLPADPLDEHYEKDKEGS